jgi:16S rRNA G966 N2-methylase RsmD
MLKDLTYTHIHKIKMNAIYIDPPYDTGAKGWTYNTDCGEKDDQYLHRHLLVMMDQCVLVARKFRTDPLSKIYGAKPARNAITTFALAHTRNVRTTTR